MKKGVTDFLAYDEENQVYYLDNEQKVKDQVEKDHWKIVLRTIIKDWRLYLMLIPMLFIFICWRYLPMYELLASFKYNFTGTNKVSEQYFCGFNNFNQL